MCENLSSKRLEEFVVPCVRTDPIPDDIPTITQPDRSIVESYSRRKDRLRGVHLLESKAGVIRIRLKQPECFAGLFLDLQG